MRQLVTFPIREARGSAATVATKIPPLTSAIAVPFASSRTSAIAAPEPNTQNPPMHTPSRALAASITAKFGAAAATRSEANTRPIKPRSSRRRSTRAAPIASSGAEIAAHTAGITTIRPATPIETCRCEPMSASRPTGISSEKTSANEPRAIDQTASQRSRVAFASGQGI